MPNQMIALQSRGAKMPDPTAQTAKFVNMMNMAKQQEAAERQASLAQQQMANANADEARRADLHGPALKKAQLEYVGLVADKFREDVAKLKDGDVAGAEAARAEAVASVPGWGNMIAPVSQWTPEYKAQLMLKAKEIVDKIYPDASASVELADTGGVDSQGRPIPKGTGIQVTTGLKPNTRVIPTADAATPAPRATPTAAPEISPSPVPVGEFGETRVAPDGGQLDEFQQDHVRRTKEGLGMTNTPASFTRGSMGAGQMTPEVMSRIADSAFQTGVMAQVDFDQLLATQPPENRQAFTDAFRRANITIQADAPSLADSGMGQQPFAANPVQRPNADFAVYRGNQPPQSQTADLGNQPMMRNTEAQYQPLQRRDPNVAPIPGIYNVPTQDVAATSRATRPSKQELYDEELAKIKAARDAGPPPLTPLQKNARKNEVAKAYTKTQALMDKAYNPKEGVIALANKIKALSDDQKESITGYSGYIRSFRASSKEADTLIGNLKGVVTGLGKDAAAASGAIGPMAVQEWTIVADMIAKLDLEGMTPRALDAQMNRIIEQVRSATNLAERVYDVQYGDDIKEYPDFKLKGAPLPRTKTPVVKGGSRISPDIDQILKSRGI
jgi:hypothetical protein